MFLSVLCLMMLAGADAGSDCGHRQMHDGKGCVPCPICPQGTGLPKSCGYGRGAEHSCAPCPAGTYNDGTTDGECVPCTNCSWYRRDYKFLCRTVINSECGDCMPGYFDDEGDALDLSRTRRCSPCAVAPQVPECLAWSNTKEKASNNAITEVSEKLTTDVQSSDARQQSIIIGLQIVTLGVFSVGVVSLLCFCLRGKITTQGGCVHINMWCKARRLPRSARVPRRTELQELGHIPRNRTGSEGDSLLGSSGSIETAFTSEFTNCTSVMSSSPQPGPSSGHPKASAPSLTCAEDKLRPSVENLHLDSPEKYYPDKLTSESSETAQSSNTRRAQANSIATVKPPAVVQELHKMAIPTVMAMPSLPNPLSVNSQEAVKTNRHVNEDEESEPSSDYPAEGSTLLIRGGAADNNLGNSQDVCETTIPMSMTSTSENRMEPFSLSLRASSDLPSDRSMACQAPSQPGTCMLSQPLFGPLSDITNRNRDYGISTNLQGNEASRTIDNPAVLTSPSKDCHSKKRPNGKSKKAAILRDLETTYCGREDSTNGVNRAVRNSEVCMASSSTNVNNSNNAGKTSTSNRGNNGTRRNKSADTAGNSTGNRGNNNFSIHINNTFMPPQMPLDTAVDLRSLFEAGNSHPQMCDGGEEEALPPGVADQMEALEKLRGQTKPKELSPILPRGCAMSSTTKTSSTFPIQETVKS